MRDRALWFGAKLNESEWDAMTQAVRSYRGSTLENISKSDIVRQGLAAFCKQQGVEFPESKPRESAMGERVKAA